MGYNITLYKMDAKTIVRFLDQMNIEVNTDDALMLDIKSGSMDIGLTNASNTLLIHGSMNIVLDDMQIPVNKFTQFYKSMATFDGIVEFDLKERLILKGKNTKKIPLCKWSDKGTKIIKIIDDSVKGWLPISIKKDEYSIVTQDKELYDKISEVFFIVKDKLLTIQLKDESGFECDTEIPDIDLPNGEYALPSYVFGILKKATNLELYLAENRAYLRETANNYVIDYYMTTRVKK